MLLSTRACVFVAIIVLLSHESATADSDECGAPMGASYRGVQAYSNGINQGKPASCLGETRTEYGLGYQCVEFARRFYATNDGPNHVTSWPSGNASELWGKLSELGLQRFPNGSNTRPEPDDILIFSAEGTDGHIAIVTNVTDTSLTVIEQNWSKSGYAELPAETRADGGYYVFSRGTKTKYEILGWMGRRSNDFTIVSSLSNPTALFVGSNDIYFSEISDNESSLSKAPKIGGSPTSIALVGKNQPVTNIDGTSTHLYFSSKSRLSNRISELTLSTLAKRQISVFGNGLFFGLFGSNMFLSTKFPFANAIQRRSISQFAVFQPVVTGTSPLNFAKDGSSIFYVDAISKSLRRFDTSPSSIPATLLNNVPLEGRVFTNETDTFLAVGNTVSIVRKTGGTQKTVTLPASAIMRGVTSSRILFSIGENQLWYKNIVDNTDAVQIVEETKIPERVIVNGRNLYWIDTLLGVSSGRILKISGPTLRAQPLIVAQGSTIMLTWNTPGVDESKCSLTGAFLGTSQSPIKHDTANDDPQKGSVSFVNTSSGGRITYTLSCPTGIDSSTVEGFESGGET